MSTTGNDTGTVWLGIDTATDWLALALWAPAAEVTVTERAILAQRNHASLLAPELQRLLADAGISMKQIGAIGVGIGPGSYTGLRVGLATARGLASGLGCPLSGVDSLQAAAFGLLAEGQQAWVTLDARRGNVYAGHYRLQDGLVSVLQEPLKIAAGELDERARQDGVRVLQAGAPKATWTARQAQAGREPDGLYL